MDFNIGNMASVIHIIDDIPIAVDEITKAYDTNQMCSIISEKHPKNKVIAYPDASGKNRNTSATETDIDIIRQHGFTVKARPKNPDVDDRIKNMNRMFCDGNGMVKYKVNTRKCPDYTEALERMAYDKNGKPDKLLGFDHITDSGGYFVYYEYPPRQKRSFTVKVS